MTGTSDSQKSFSWFAVLMGLCCIGHLSIHLSQAELSAHWLLCAVVLVASAWVISRPTVERFLCLAAAQLMSAIEYAPFNADHWLLISFVNVIALGAAWKIHRGGHLVTPERLMGKLVPGARLLFVVCYGFAALSKYNYDFIFDEHSSARELLKYQIDALPVMSWLTWPPTVSWITLACESSVPVLILFASTRRLGILIGLFFHAALVVSPAIKVFDFTIAVYAMLYLFTPNGFEQNLRNGLSRLRIEKQQESGTQLRPLGFLAWGSIVAIIAISFQSGLEAVELRFLYIRWLAAMGVLTVVACLMTLGMLDHSQREQTFRWLPRWGLPYAVITLALLNGLCPYLGFKTMGSFTMFSNLRTEAGRWNHLLIPPTVRVVDRFQDQLVRVVASDDAVLDETYVQPDLLATEFEIRRRVMQNPSISLTVQRGGEQVVINPANTDEVLGSPLNQAASEIADLPPRQR